MIRHFNLIELNLGLCIRNLRKWSGAPIADADLSTMSLGKKVREFVRLSEEWEPVRSKNLGVQIAEWAARVDEVRRVRNIYVHGHWDLLPLREDYPVSVFVPPWMVESMGLTYETKMTVSDLQDRAKATQIAFEDFAIIRKNLGV